MDTGVAPVAVEIEGFVGGTRADEREKLAGDLDRDVLGVGLGFADQHGCMSGGVGIGSRTGDIERTGGAKRQRLGGVEFRVELTEAEQQERIFRRAHNRSAETRALARADGSGGIVEGVLRDANVDGGVKELGKGMEGRGPFEKFPMGDNVSRRHGDGAKMCGTAVSGALSEGVPIIEQFHADGGARDVGEHKTLLVIDGGNGQPMREERTGRIMFGAIEKVVSAGTTETGFEIERGGGAALGLGIAEPGTGQNLGKKELFLLLGAILAESIEENKVTLRQLGDGGIGGGEDLKNLRERLGGNIGSPMGAGHGQGKEPAGRKQIEFRDSLAALAITVRSLGREQCRDLAGNRERFAIRRYDMCRGN